jgi:hypothetical protein
LQDLQVLRSRAARLLIAENMLMLKGKASLTTIMLSINALNLLGPSSTNRREMLMLRIPKRFTRGDEVGSNGVQAPEHRGFFVLKSKFPL